MAYENRIQWRVVLKRSRVLIDASNLILGGSVQVAASFLTELAKLSSEYDWVGGATVWASRQVAENIDEGDAALPFAVEIVEFQSPLRRFLGRSSRTFDVAFSIFGPTYRRRMATTEIAGFAAVTLVYSDPLHRRRSIVGQAAMFVRRWSAKRYDRYIVETAALQDRLSQQLDVPTDSIKIVPNCVSGVFEAPDEWAPVSLPALPKDVTTLSFVSRYYPHKNFALLGEMGQRLEENFGLRVRFLTTLDEQEWGRLTPLTRTFCVNVGPLTVRQVPTLIALSDAAVFPSLLEAFSAFPLEALAVGRVLFASDRDFVRSVVGIHAVYIDPLDPDAAAAVVANCLIDRSDWSARERAGMSFVSTWPSAQERARSYCDEITKALHPTHTL